MTEILDSQVGAVRYLVLNRASKMNAITRDMYARLASGLNEAAGDFAVRAVVITSEGNHFTAGNDIMDFMDNPPTADSSEVATFLAALLNFPKPLIAAVKGNAVGVGTTMLLHCDVVVASPTANFSMPFTSLGLVPEAGSTFLFPALVGYQRAARIFMTGESFGPEAALEMGIISEINSDALEAATKIAEHIADQPPQAIINTKALLKARHHDAVSAVMRAEFEIFAMALQSDEAREAFMKFMSKKGSS
jgi:enoyl-CoA hydratase/carnithine racemase